VGQAAVALTEFTLVHRQQVVFNSRASGKDDSSAIVGLPPAFCWAWRDACGTDARRMQCQVFGVWLPWLLVRVRPPALICAWPAG